jgi:hypothetical protein
MINQSGFDFLFDPVDFEARIEEVAQTTLFVLPNILDEASSSKILIGRTILLSLRAFGAPLWTSEAG